MGDNNTILEFECLGIENGGIFPPEHTGRGEDSSPEFIIHNLSEQCNTLAITLEDLSHPIKGFTHWLIWNIPAAKTVPGAIPASKILPSLGNAKQGVAYGIHRYAETAERENAYLSVYIVCARLFTRTKGEYKKAQFFEESRRAYIADRQYNSKV